MLLRLFMGGTDGDIPLQVMGILFGGVAGIMVYISLDELLPTSRAYGMGHGSLNSAERILINFILRF